MLGYPKFCKCLHLYTGITQGDLAEGQPAAPAPPAITSAPVPAAMLISCTPSPSLWQSGDMPTWIAAAYCVPYCCWNSAWPAWPMHTKCKMVFTCLPDAMLNSSTALDMTQMAPSRTAPWGIPASVGAVQLANDRPTYIGTFSLLLPPLQFQVVHCTY